MWELWWKVHVCDVCDLRWPLSIAVSCGVTEFADPCNKNRVLLDLYEEEE